MRFLLIVFSAVALCVADRVHGQNQTGPDFIVSTLTDRNNSTAKVGDCTLREALRAAASYGQEATITFSPNLSGTITLGASLGSLNVTGKISVIGPGARKLAIAGPGSARVLKISSAGPHLISGLTLKSGKQSAAGTVVEGGAGIWNLGKLTLMDCAVTGNEVTSDASHVAMGGGIYNQGTLTLKGCQFSANSAKGGESSGAHGANGFGGAIYNDDGTVSAEQCTFSGNTGTGGTGTTYKGQACGAIYNYEGTLSLTRCTVSGNTGTGGAQGAKPSAGVGAIWNDGGTCKVISSVIAGNMAVGYSAHKDVRGNFVSQGYNLVGAMTPYPPADYVPSGFNLATDQKGTYASPKDAKLGTLQNNGGQTDTMLPQEGSPLLDKGVDGSLTEFEQRGYFRVSDDEDIDNTDDGNGTDIGAVEVQPAITENAAVSFNTDRALIRLTGKPGVTYQFQYSDDLQPPWTDFGTPSTADGAGLLRVIDTSVVTEGPEPSRRFYRGISAAP